MVRSIGWGLCWGRSGLGFQLPRPALNEPPAVEAGCVNLTHNPPPFSPRLRTQRPNLVTDRVSLPQPSYILTVFSVLSPFVPFCDCLSAAPFLDICSDYILHVPQIPHLQYTYIPFLAGI